MAMRPVARSVYCRPKTHDRLIRFCRKTRTSATSFVDKAILTALAAAAKKTPAKSARK